MKIKTLILLCIFSITLSSCRVNPILGNVYKFESIEGHHLKEEYLIKGLRIDDFRNDTLFVKYKFSNELFLDADFVYDDSLNVYKTPEEIILGAEADKKSVIFLTFDEQKNIFLKFINFSNNDKVKYKKKYKMKVDLKTHRNPYYAEDGFSL